MALRPFGYTGWTDPYADLRRIQDEMNRVLGRTGVSAAMEYPPVNVYANDDGVLVVSEIPGVARSDLEITVDQNTLVLKGRREPPGEGEVTFHRRERRTGAFARSVALPFPVEAGKVDARLENGVLRVQMMRHEADKPHRIEIRAG
jgi:HSP20 family protein